MHIFSLTGVSPPVSADQLDNVINILEGKCKSYLDDGEKKADDDKANMEKNIERDVAKEIEREN